MKKNKHITILKYILYAFLLICVSCEKVPFENYGKIISDKKYQNYIDIYQKIQSGYSENIILKGKIVKTCPVKGCWMDVKVAENDTIKVRFKDYGFFVPREGMEGKQTIIEGTGRMDTLSVSMLRHYAEDAGKNSEEILAITEPVFKFQFTAEGVLIEK